MRYGVKSPSMEDSLHQEIQAFREAALENDMESAEVLEGGEGWGQADTEGGSAK